MSENHRQHEHWRIPDNPDFAHWFLKSFNKSWFRLDNRNNLSSDLKSNPPNRPYLGYNRILAMIWFICQMRATFTFVELELGYWVWVRLGWNVLFHIQDSGGVWQKLKFSKCDYNLIINCIHPILHYKFEFKIFSF